MSIRVLIVDDHPTLRLGLKILIESNPEFQLVGEAGTGVEALSKATTLLPDIMLLDCVLPDMSGGKVAKAIQDLGLTIRILCFSGFDDEDHVFEILDAGATGYLLKTETTKTLLDAIKIVSKGGYFLSPTIVKKVAFQGRLRRTELLLISKRETEVLRRLIYGESNGQIAQALGISIATVKNHLTSIYSKLNVTSRGEAMAWAWENGIRAQRKGNATKTVGTSS